MREKAECDGGGLSQNGPRPLRLLRHVMYDMTKPTLPPMRKHCAPLQPLHYCSPNTMQATNPPSHLFLMGRSCGPRRKSGKRGRGGPNLPNLQQGPVVQPDVNRPQESEPDDELEEPEADFSLVCAVRCMRSKQRSHQDAP